VANPCRVIEVEVSRQDATHIFRAQSERTHLRSDLVAGLDRDLAHMPGDTGRVDALGKCVIQV
jgi:hypothetical protein